MNSLLRELKAQALSGLRLPAGRFFTPTPVFFEALTAYHVDYIDAGCGSGDTTVESNAAGLHMTGVDIAERDGERPGILHIDALDMPYSPDMWPVICRPSHDGWAEDVAEKALLSGAHVFYAGFAKNHAEDLGRLKHFIVRRWKKAGRSDEGLVLLSPDSFRPKRYQ
jgi:hypothetical protein